MRSASTATVFAVLAALSAAQSPQGTYSALGAEPQQWRVNEHHALVWNGSPYMPVGVRIAGNPDEVRRVKGAGISDAIVEVPASGSGWKPCIDALEAAGMRYLLAIDSLAPGASGVAVEPQSYRITGITKPRRIEITIPGATRAYLVLATRHDGEVRRTARVATPEGRLAYEVEPPNSLEHVLLIYPTMTTSSVVDCWDGFDRHRDALLRALKVSSPGPGLRGILNPVGDVFHLRSNASFVPDSPLFRYEFKEYLQNKYRSVETVMRAWSMSISDLDSMDQLARLIPLWSGSRGVPRLLDPVTDKIHLCDSRRSSIWTDIVTVLNTAMARRFGRIATSLRQVCDVPIVQEWSDWAAPYESGTALLDGLAARTVGGSLSSIAETAARASSSVSRRTTPGWFIASLIDLAGASDQAGQVPAVIEDLTSMGCRAWFARASDPATLNAVASEVANRPLNDGAAQWSPRAVFFPESATNPAGIMRLPGSRWWLPAPFAGNRVDLGPNFFAYRLDNADASFFALWSVQVPTRVKLFMADPKSVGFSSVDGTNPNPKIVKGGVEVTISQLPLLITGTQEIPVPEPAAKEAIARFDQLLIMAEARHIDATEYRFLFQDAASGLERNPGGSFVALLQQLHRLSDRLGAFTWIEGEKVNETNFSELVQVPGTSGGSVLSLTSAFSGSSEPYAAEYLFQPRTEADLDCWVAARIPKEYRTAVRVVVGGSEFRLAGEPIGLYGQGFGWYRVTTTRFKRGETKLTVKVLPTEGVDLQIDAILLAPPGFSPNGLRRPEP